VVEFISAIGIMSNGSQQDKLRFVFQMYDADGNGTLDKEEVLQIFKVTSSLKGTYVPLPQLKRMVEDTFKEIDLNNDGHLDFNEFELAIKRNQLEVNTRVAFVGGGQ
jgi:Ca2+-binding EF-hand superfamily protein